MLALERAGSSGPVGSSRSTKAGVITLVGLILLPLVIAGGFLWGTWNSDERLDRVQAAVVNLDEAVKVGDQTVPLGRQLSAGLVDGEADQNFTWVLSDASDASSGLESGKYAAVVTIPKSFSARATSFSENDADKAKAATIDVQTSEVTGLADPVLGQAIASAATKALNTQLTEQYVQGIYVGFNTINKQFGTVAEAATKLSDGADGLSTGINATSKGTKELAAGIGKLDDGTQGLAKGLSSASTGADEFATGFSKLAAGTKDLPKQTRQLADGAGASADGAEKLADGAKKLNSGLPAFTKGTQANADGTAAYAKGVKQFSRGAKANAIGVGQFADGVGELSKGAKKNATGVGQFADGVSELSKGAQANAAGASNYSAGVQKFASGVAQAAAGPQSCPEEILALGDGACAGFLAAFGSINDQAQELAKGYVPLSEGAAGLSAGVATLSTNATKLDAGASQLSAGASTLSTNATKLDKGATQLSDGAAALSTNATKLATGAKAIDTGADQLAGGVDGIATGTKSLAGGLTQLADGTDQLAVGTKTLSAGITAASTGAIGLADGIGKLSDGASLLADGTSASASGANELSKGLIKLSDGGEKLADGSAQLADGLEKGKDQIPTYTTSERTKLSAVVTTPVSSNQPDGLFSNVASTTFLAVLALWIGALASFIVLRAVSARVLTSMKPSWRLVADGWLPSVLAVAAQSVILTVLLQVLLDLSAVQVATLLPFTLLTGVAFVAVNHALVAWFGGVGRFISVIMVVLTAASAITSAVPAVLDDIRVFLPLNPALEGLRAIVTDGTGTSGAVGLLLAWTVVGAVASVLAVARHRVVRPLVSPVPA